MASNITITLADVAKHAGVSPTQVSFVVNQKNLDRVSQERQHRIKIAIKELNYTPNLAARQLAGKQTHFLGVIMHSQVAQINYARLQAIDEQALKLGYQVLVGKEVGSYTNQPINPPHLSTYNLDGLICIAHDYHHDPKAVPRQLQHSPHVVYFERPRIEGAWYVQEDVADAGRQCVEYLLSIGRKRLSLCLSDKMYQYNLDRLQGYTDALNDAGMEVDEQLIYLPDEAICCQKLETQQADVILDQLVDSAGSDAIVAYNDFWAARLIQSLHRRGMRVPDDVAVIGLNNLAFAELMSPALTTIDERSDEVGRLLVNMLVDKIEGRDVPESKRRVTVKTKLIVRDSA